MNDVEVSERSAPMFSRILSHRAGRGDKVLVLAHDQQDSHAWARANSLPLAHILTVTRPDDMRGVKTADFPRVQTEKFADSPNNRSVRRALVQYDNASGRVPAWR